MEKERVSKYMDVGKKWLDKRTGEEFEISELYFDKGYIIDTDGMKTDMSALMNSPDLEPIKDEVGK